MSTAYIGKADLLALAGPREADHTLPDGNVLRIREMTAPEYLAVLQAGDLDDTGKIRDAAGFYAMLTIVGTLDGPQGRPLFSPNDFEQVKQLAQLRDRPWLLPLELGNAIWNLSEVGPESTKSVDTPVDEAGDIHADIRTGDADGGDH